MLGTQLTLLLAALASAQAGGNPADPAPPPPGPAQVAVDRAEYFRLDEYMHSLAKRQAWDGVERTWQKILATGVEPSFEDLMVAAKAAEGLGDVASVRERLIAAHHMREEREVIDWLWTLDQTYVPVQLAVDVGEQLSITLMPFNQTEARVIEFAIAEVAKDGTYDGYLPAGNYLLQGETFGVRAGLGPVHVDLRSADTGKKKKK